MSHAAIVAPPPPLSWPPIFSGDTPRVTETLIPSWIYTCPAHLQREEASTLNIYLQSIYIQGRNFGCEQYQHPLSLSLLPPLRFVYGSLNWAFSSPPFLMSPFSLSYANGQHTDACRPFHRGTLHLSERFLNSQKAKRDRLD